MFDVTKCDNSILPETKVGPLKLNDAKASWPFILGEEEGVSIKSVFSLKLLKRFLEHLLFTLEGDQKERDRRAFSRSLCLVAFDLQGSAAVRLELEEEGPSKNADDDV